MVSTSKLSTIARGALGLLLMLTCVFDEVVGIVRRNDYKYILWCGKRMKSNSKREQNLLVRLADLQKNSFLR